jgi:predicted ribosomally synthesized peptide with SipW-like signal peptide
MRKILLSLLTIGLVVSATAGATRAAFSDTETVVGNTFTAGSLDLELGEKATLPFTFSNVAPSDNGNGKVTLTNVGSLPGTLSINWIKTIDEENDMLEPETRQYPRPLGGSGLTTGDYLGNGGELDFFLQFAPFIDVDKDGNFDAGDIQLAYHGQSTSYPGYRSGALYYSGLNSYLSSWNGAITLNSGESVDLVIPWQFPSETTDNNYHQNISMTDSLGFDVVFELEQTP